MSEQGRYNHAEPLHQRALAIRQQSLGPQHPDVAESLHEIANLRQMQKNIAESLSLYQQALTIREQKLGPYHLKTVETRTAYIQLLREVGRIEEAETIEAQVPEQDESFGEVITSN